MSTRIAINGFGRVGRSFLRVALQRRLEVVAINDLTSPETLAHLLTYDSTYGRITQTVEAADGALIVNGSPITVSAIADPALLDWGKCEVDVVVEATGRLRQREDAAMHLKAGARKVIISAPGKGADVTVVMGVNDADYDSALHDVISNASCTTNCVAPMVKVLNDELGLLKGLMTTVHGYTNDQALLDGPHRDLHRARSAAINIIPTSTGAARNTGLVIREVAGRLDGLAIRVPVEDGSLVDLTAILARPASVADVNSAFERAAAHGPLSGVLRYNTAPIVSRDVIGDPASCIFDAGLTLADEQLVKVFGWYDNEYGYSCRLADLVETVAAQL